MDLLRTLNEIRPGESFGCDDGIITMSNITWYSQKVYTPSEYEGLEDKSNVIFNEEANVYTETPFTIPTQQECEDYWTTTLQNKITLKSLRHKRNALLDQSDKYVTVDFPHTTPEKKQEWLDYRQALRDLPTATAYPANPVWPPVPSP